MPGPMPPPPRSTPLPAAATLTLAFALAFVLLPGCKWTQTPTAEVTRVEVVSQGREGGVLAFDVRVDNANDFPLTLPRASYTVTVDGAGTYDSPPVIPMRTLSPLGEQVLRFTAAFPANAPLSGRDYSLSGSASYDDPSELRQAIEETGLPKPWFDFASQGTLP